MPNGYTLTQVRLHWVVALLVLAQFLNDDAIGGAWRAFRRGSAEVAGGLLVTLHVVVGIAILIFALWRISLRLSNGTPPAPAEEPRALQIVAAATHGLLYLALIALPLTGLAAWFGGIGSAGEVHEIMTNALLALVGLHVLGALYQRFVLKTDVLNRMLPR